MQMKRASKEDVYISMALELSCRSTCLDKQVGCVITNGRNEIIATGYNGAPRGIRHCIDTGSCIKTAFSNPNKCLSAHAEQNALLQCKVPEQIDTIYTTLSPCIVCVRMIMNTPCKQIIFLHKHAHTEAEELWEGRWIHYGH